MHSNLWRVLGYLSFLAAFLLEMALCATHPENLAALTPLQTVLLGVAAFRGGRAVSSNAVFAWLRAPFCRVVADTSGAGDSVVAREDIPAFLYAIGDCLSCPICTGTHIAGILLTLLALFPAWGIPLLYALGGAGIAETFHWVSEAAEWVGRAAREQAGTEWLRKNSTARQVDWGKK